MTDIYSADKRRDIMRRVRSKEGKAEKLVFRYLNSNRIYYQKHYSRVAGKPDVALPRKKRAVFIDGDFWHGRSYDKVLRLYPPNSYWVNKIARNMERDKQQRQELIENGWSLLVVWESDILRKKTCQDSLESIKAFLQA